MGDGVYMGRTSFVSSLQTMSLFIIHDSDFVRPGKERKCVRIVSERGVRTHTRVCVSVRVCLSVCVCLFVSICGVLFRGLLWFLVFGVCSFGTRSSSYDPPWSQYSGQQSRTDRMES